jgi:hypothetical protein
MDRPGFIKVGAYLAQVVLVQRVLEHFGADPKQQFYCILANSFFFLFFSS